MTLAVLIIFIILFIVTMYPRKKIRGRKRCEYATDKVSSLTKVMPWEKDSTSVETQPSSGPAAAEYMADPSVPGYDDYKQYIMNTGIESSVIDSHRQFAKEINTSTSGASAQTVLSHDDSIVPTWGLRRRSAYVPVSENAREVPSQTDAQMKDNSRKHSYNLF